MSKKGTRKELIHAIVRSTTSIQLLLLAAVLVLWEGIASAGVFSTLLFPSIGSMLDAFSESVASGEFAHHLSRTLLEIFVALLIAIIVGSSVGIAIGTVQYMRAIFEPLLLAAFCIPLVALFPLLILLFGIGMNSKIVFAAIYGFFPICFNACSAVASVDRTLLSLGRSLGAKRIVTLRKIVVPAVLPGVVAGIQQGVALVIIGTVASEMFASISGLGYLIEYSFTLFEIAKVYAMAFVTLLIALVLNIAIRRALTFMLARAHHYQPSIEE